MFLVIFTALLGSGTVHLAGRTVKESTYYVAAMAAFAVISACYTNVAMTVTFQRDAGILKRVDGTPLPAGVYFAGRVLHALFVAILLVVITAAFGRLAYQASVPTGITLVHFLVMLVVGAGSFCALGFAITTVIPNADASPAIVNATILPCCSSRASSSRSAPTPPAGSSGWRAYSRSGTSLSGMQAGFLGTSFDWVDVVVVAAWGAAGLLIAIRRFSWEPRTLTPGPAYDPAMKQDGAPLSQRERWALCDLLTELGPDSPTLCAGWRSADLAAHLLTRERRPDTALGAVEKPGTLQDMDEAGTAGRARHRDVGHPRQQGAFRPTAATAAPGPGHQHDRVLRPP